jgi:CspA family cold shock protein
VKQHEAKADQLATGRVLQFDQERGYGFIAADDGGEDVFLHASVFDGDSCALAPGIRMEFKVMAGERGRKAFAAHLVPDEPDREGASVRPPRPSATAVPSVQSVPSVPAPWPVPVPPQGPAPGPPAPRPPDEERGPDDEPMCDVLSSTEFGQEVTELLLSSAPTLTGRQVLEVRESVLECAKKHGWVDL